MGIAGVTGDELGRRLVAVHRTAPLSLSIIRISRHHSIQLLPLNIGHSVHLLMKLLGPFLLVLDYLLARIAVHVRLSVAQAQNLLVRLLILILCQRVAIIFKLLLRLLIWIQGVFLQFVDVLEVKSLG